MQLVDASSTVFRAFASETGEREPRRRRPARHAQPDDGDARPGADVRRPARPDGEQPAPGGACAAGGERALTALAKPSTPIVAAARSARSCVAARPVVRDLSPAAVDLATCGTPNLQKVFGVLNHLVNMLGYSPGGAQHGYLWWLAWLGHNTRTLFSLQDANGPYRPLFIQFSCPQIATLTNPGSAFALVGWLLNLTPLRPFCPGLAPARDTAASALRPPPRNARTDVHRSPLCHEDRHDGAVRALVRRAAAVPVAVVRRHDPVRPPGVPLPGLVPQRPAARHAGRCADRRGVGRQGGRQVARSTGQPHDRHDRARQAVRADPPRRAGDPAREDDHRRDVRRADARIADRRRCCRTAALLARDQRRARGAARPDLQRAGPGDPPGVPGLAAAAGDGRRAATARTSTVRSATCRSSPPTPATSCGCSTSSTVRPSA